MKTQTNSGMKWSKQIKHESGNRITEENQN